MNILTRWRGRRDRGDAPPDERPGRDARPEGFGERVAVVGGGLIVAGAGAVLSWSGQSTAARGAFEAEWLGWLVPVANDGLIVFGSAGWLMAVRAGHRATGFRTTAHLGIALSILLNIYAVWGRKDLIPWHVVGALAVSLVLEVVTKHLADLRKAAEVVDDADRIPLRLWLSNPAECGRTVLRMARTGERRASVARVEAGAARAAVMAVRLVMPVERRWRWRVVPVPDRVGRMMRREITDRILDGSLSPSEAFAAVDDLGADQLDARSQAFLARLRVAAAPAPVPAEPERMTEVDGRTDGQTDGSDGWADGEPEWVAPLVAEVGGLVPGRMDLGGATSRPFAGGAGWVGRSPSGGGSSPGGEPSRVAVGAVRGSAARPTIRAAVAQTGARPQDVETARKLIEAKALPVDERGVPTADNIVTAFREHGHKIGLTYARKTREHFEAQADAEAS